MKNVLRSATLMATSALLLAACANTGNTRATTNAQSQAPTQDTIQNAKQENVALQNQQSMRERMSDKDMTVDQQLKLESIMQERMPDLNLTVDQQIKIQAIMHDGLGDYQRKRDAMFEVLTPAQRQMMMQMHAQDMNNGHMMNQAHRSDNKQMSK